MELRRQSGEHHLIGSVTGIRQEFQENHCREWALSSRSPPAALRSPDVTKGLRQVPSERIEATAGSCQDQ